MQKNSKIIQFFAFLALLYFILAGTGHNIVDYCCDTCEDAGIESISHTSCNDLHHTTYQSEPVCCDSASHDNKANECSIDGTCQVQRLSLGDFTVAVTLSVQSIPDYSDQLYFQIEHLLADKSICKIVLFYPPPEPVILQGRDVLTLKSVLII